MTLDSAQIDLSNAFVEGMGYVALSRVKGLSSLSLDGINAMALRVSPVAKQIDIELQERSLKAVNNHEKIIKEWETKPLDTNLAKYKTDKSKAKLSWSDKLARMRQEYPNAYKPWSDTDDKKLLIEFSNCNTVDSLSKSLGRHKGSIKARLQKHLGEDIFG